MCEIYCQQDITFTITQQISTSTRSVSIAIQWRSLLSPNEPLSFLQQSSRMIRTIPTIKRESSSLLSPRMTLSFVGPWSTMNQDNQFRWSEVSEIHFSLSNRMSLSFVDYPRQWSSNSRRSKVTEIHFCPHRLNLFFSRSIRRQWSRQSRRSNVGRVHFSLLEWI